MEKKGPKFNFLSFSLISLILFNFFVFSNFLFFSFFLIFHFFILLIECNFQKHVKSNLFMATYVEQGKAKVKTYCNTNGLNRLGSKPNVKAQAYLHEFVLI